MKAPPLNELTVKWITATAFVRDDGKWQSEMMVGTDGDEDAFEFEWAEVADDCWSCLSKAIVRLERDLRESTVDQPVHARSP